MAFPPREEYEQFLYNLPGQYSEIRSSTLKLYSNSPTTCIVKGSILFEDTLELKVFEYLDCADGELLAYSYTIFRGKERIRWYDPQPHPNEAQLSSTFPHHLHEPPDIKHNRQPAPGIDFGTPNLVTLIRNCLEIIQSSSDD